MKALWLKVGSRLKGDTGHSVAMASSCYLYFDTEGQQNDQDKIERVLAAINQPVTDVSFHYQTSEKF